MISYDVFTAEYVFLWWKNDDTLQNGWTLLKYDIGFSNANRKRIIHRRRNICRRYTCMWIVCKRHPLFCHPNRLIRLQIVFLDRKCTRPINAIFTKEIVFATLGCRTDKRGKLKKTNLLTKFENVLILMCVYVSLGREEKYKN